MGQVMGAVDWCGDYLLALDRPSPPDNLEVSVPLIGPLRKYGVCIVSIQIYCLFYHG